MKKIYLCPNIVVVELKVGRSLLEELSGTETVVGGEVDDSRGYDSWSDDADSPTQTTRRRSLWEDESIDRER